LPVLKNTKTYIFMYILSSETGYWRDTGFSIFQASNR